MNKKDFQLAKVHVHITPGEALKMLRELQGLSQNDLYSFSGCWRLTPHPLYFFQR